MLLGYNAKTKDVDGMSGISTGLGLRVNSYEIDYAFVPFGDLGETHRFSFNYRFGK